MQLTELQAAAQKPPTGGLTRSKPGTSQSPNLYSIESFRKHGPKSPSTAVTKSIIRSESGSVGAGQGVKPMALKPVPVKEQIQVRNEVFTRGPFSNLGLCSHSGSRLCVMLETLC